MVNEVMVDMMRMVHMVIRPLSLQQLTTAAQSSYGKTQSSTQHNKHSTHLTHYDHDTQSDPADGAPSW